MTATNHIATGALVALAVNKQPAVAVLLAFISHFILDAIPHFGIHEDDVLKRNSHRLFRSVVTADTIMGVLMFVALPIIGHGVVSWGWIVAAQAAAFLPDAVWIYRYLDEIRTRIIRPHGWYAWFHQRIQWSEKPWGLAVEGVWLLAVVIGIASLI